MVWYGMVWYGMESMVCYQISMLCYEISMICYALVYVVKDKHSATVSGGEQLNHQQNLIINIHLSPPLKINGQTLFHPIEKANALTNFSTSISCIQCQLELPPQGLGPPLNQMEAIHITENEVQDQLQIINTCKPPGPDTVSP